MSQKSEIKIGLLGFGTVGQGVWKNIENNRLALEARLGVSLKLVKAGVRSLDKERSVQIEPSLLTTDLDSIVDDPEIDILCELMGGTGQARDLTLRALRSGKAVVSANKALICDHGDELFAASREFNAPFFYEASVAGGIPVIKALQEGLVANRFKLIFGILNGTSNYILTRMAREGISFEETLGDARELGYVEADESLDLDGVDAAHKAVILAYLAHGRWIKLDGEAVVEGIRKVTSEDIHVAARLGYKIKLLGIISRDFSNDTIWLRVVPCLIPKAEVMADVDEVFNGVSITGDVVGTTMLIGRGAGQDATSSSVIGDIADAVIALQRKSEALDAKDDVVGGHVDQVTLAEPGSIESSFYCRLQVQDRVGTLSEVTHVLAKQGISIASVRQTAAKEGSASLVITTHKTNEKAMGDAIVALEALPALETEPTTFRIFKPADLQ